MRRILAIVALALLVITASDTQAHTPIQSDAETGEVLVKFAPGAAMAMPQDASATPLAEWPNIYKITGSSTQGLLQFYATQAGVVWAAPNYQAFAQDDPADTGVPYFSFPDGLPADLPDAMRPFVTEANITATVNDPLSGQQYSLDRMQVYTAWDRSKGDGVVVGIVDSGTTFSHPDLQGKFVSRGKDYINNDDDATDDQGHGTHVSGIIAAATNNNTGISGVGYNAKFLMCKGLGANGSGGLDVVANCVKWLADQGVKIINMSLGCKCPHPIHEEYVNYAWSKGAVVIAAAGNDGDGVNRFYPASVDNAIGICATDRNDNKSAFSNYGPNVDLCAPGSSILSTVRTGGYEAWDGTSMAAPNASGVAALVLAANPGMTNVQLRQRLESTADDLGAPGRDNIYGSGRINAARAVGNSTAPTPTPGPTQPAPTVQPTSPPSNNFEDEVERLINIERANNGLGPLRHDDRLRRASRFHNEWMDLNNCFAHNCPGEPDVFQRMRNAGYPVVSGGENIGAGYRTPAEMVAGWMASPGHRAAILNTYWPDLGCAYRYAANNYRRHFWTCDFGRSNEAPQPTAAPTQTRVPTGTALPTGVPSRTPTPRPTQTALPTTTVAPTQTRVPTGTALPTGVPSRTPTTAPPTPVPGRSLWLVFVDGSVDISVRAAFADLARRWRYGSIQYWTVQDSPAADQYVQLYAYTAAQARADFEAFCAQYDSLAGVDCRYQ